MRVDAGLSRRLFATLAFTLALLLPLLAIPGQAQPRTRLTLWFQTETLLNKGLQEFIEEYQRQNPGIEIVQDTAPHAKHVERVNIALMGGSGPDLFDLSERDALRLYAANVLSPLDFKAFKVDDIRGLYQTFAPPSLRSFIHQGVSYGVPVSFAIYSFAINTDHFREAGLNPDTDYPKTWDDVIRIGKKLVKYEGDRMTRQAIAFPFGMSSAWYALAFQPLVWQQEDDIVSPDGKQARLDQPAAVNALQLWFDIVFKHKLLSLLRANEKYDVEFANGTISMWFGANWQAPTFELYNPAIKGRFKIIPFPSMTGGKRAVATTAWGWFVPKVSRNPTEAWKFIAYFSSRLDDWYRMTGMLVPGRWVKDPSPLMKVWIDDAAQGRALLLHPKSPEIADALQRALERCLLNGVAPKVVLKEANDEVNRILRAP